MLKFGSKWNIQLVVHKPKSMTSFQRACMSPINQKAELLYQTNYQGYTLTSPNTFHCQNHSALQSIQCIVMQCSEVQCSFVQCSAG